MRELVAAFVMGTLWVWGCFAVLDEAIGRDGRRLRWGLGALPTLSALRGRQGLRGVRRQLFGLLSRGKVPQSPYMQHRWDKLPLPGRFVERMPRRISRVRRRHGLRVYRLRQVPRATTARRDPFRVGLAVGQTESSGTSAGMRGMGHDWIPIRASGTQYWQATASDAAYGDEIIGML